MRALCVDCLDGLAGQFALLLRVDAIAWTEFEYRSIGCICHQRPSIWRGYHCEYRMRTISEETSLKFVQISVYVDSVKDDDSMRIYAILHCFGCCWVGQSARPAALDAGRLNTPFGPHAMRSYARTGALLRCLQGSRSSTNSCTYIVQPLRLTQQYRVQLAKASTYLSGPSQPDSTTSKP